MKKINRPQWNIPSIGAVPLKEDPKGSVLTVGEYVAYLYQAGLPEWQAKQEYYKDSFTRYGPKLYVSSQNGNIGHLPDDPLWWVPYSMSSEGGSGTSPSGTYDVEATADTLVMRTAAGKAKAVAGTAGTELINFGQFGSDHSTVGYQELPSGIIIQWGTGASADESFGENYFNTPFPTACLRIVGNFHSDCAVDDGAFLVVQMIDRFRYGLLTHHLVSGSIAWIAVGH